MHQRAVRRAALSVVVALVATLLPVGTARALTGPAPSYFPADADVVDVASTPSGDGFWLLDQAGGVHAFGDAGYHGSLAELVASSRAEGGDPAVRLLPSGGGYRIVTAAGHVLAFGSATSEGSLPEMRAAEPGTGAAPVVDAATTPDGDGYWLLDASGGVFAFGTARFFGSVPGLADAGTSVGTAPLRGLAPVPDGEGYWIADASGGVFAFGSAAFLGSLPQLRSRGVGIGAAAVGDVVASTTGDGYWLVDGTGGVFSFGTTAFHGSAPGRGVDFTPVAVAPRPGDDGYWLVDATGTVLTFGAAAPLGAASIPGGGPLPPHPDPDGGYALLPLLDGAPGRWLPCRPVHYVVHLDDGAPAGTFTVIRRAVRKVSAATGIPFVLDGTTDERLDLFRPLRDPERYGNRLSPMLVSVESPRLGNPFDEEGLFLGAAFVIGGLGKIVFGEVGVNLAGAGFGLTDEAGSWDTRAVESTLMHELGHAVGLGHAPAPGQVMSGGEHVQDVEDLLTVDWQAGDRRGLRRVGRAAGCDTRPGALVQAAETARAIEAAAGGPARAWIR